MDLNSKIIGGLSRISEVFKVLLWEHAKILKLSPIQIQILIFITYHRDEFCKVSYLAKEFNVTKPTISDAVRVLVNKELLIKDFSSADSRSYSLLVSAKGKEIVKETEDFTNPIRQQLNKIDPNDKDSFYITLSKLIYQLNRSGILTVQRSCFNCKFYNNENNRHYCNLLETKLLNTEIRLDCPEYQDAS
ncbi:DNA-binding transcriptional regulator, MarR family [Aquimarina amphilecti]|uniref:DNA-binding transcriptional regulator, MarR family n=1 Tax=Aquimarina amphilecti TaxID=1038014 RepID=A0A1H7QR14_AQUAM|nr:helix-turn-helix domain-containing protein [Aquimarina amphilecti]SEL50329.1 DNA-binding transcriptional regulator, MarR family [Aquimarina amphilecti]